VETKLLDVWMYFAVFGLPHLIWPVHKYVENAHKQPKICHNHVGKAPPQPLLLPDKPQNTSKSETEPRTQPEKTPANTNLLQQQPKKTQKIH
jgi:hypothetical protein